MEHVYVGNVHMRDRARSPDRGRRRLNDALLLKVHTNSSINSVIFNDTRAESLNEQHETTTNENKTKSLSHNNQKYDTAVTHSSFMDCKVKEVKCASLFFRIVFAALSSLC